MEGKVQALETGYEGGGRNEWEPSEGGSTSEELSSHAVLEDRADRFVNAGSGFGRVLSGRGEPLNEGSGIRAEPAPGFYGERNQVARVVFGTLSDAGPAGRMAISPGTGPGEGSVACIDAVVSTRTRSAPSWKTTSMRVWPIWPGTGSLSSGKTCSLRGRGSAMRLIHSQRQWLTLSWRAVRPPPGAQHSS